MKKIFSVILCSVLMFSLVACARTEAKKQDTSKVTVKEETKPDSNVVAGNVEVKSSEVVMYFSDDQAMNLVGVKRTIVNPTAKSIVSELLKGPDVKTAEQAKLVATLPVGVEIIDVQVKEDIAYVDFKGNVSEKISGSAGEGMALYSIINTLVLDKELGIKKVQFLVDGKNVESIAGHYDVSKPMIEDLNMIKK